MAKKLTVNSQKGIFGSSDRQMSELKLAVKCSLKRGAFVWPPRPTMLDSAMLDDVGPVWPRLKEQESSTGDYSCTPFAFFDQTAKQTLFVHWNRALSIQPKIPNTDFETGINRPSKIALVANLLISLLHALNLIQHSCTIKASSTKLYFYGYAYRPH